MENNELNNIVLNNVKNKIVVSNLEREVNMKIRKRKEVISLCAVILIFLSGSFITVNAATDGKLAETIKEKYEEIVVVKVDEDKYKVVNEGVQNIDGEDYISYKITSNDGLEEQDLLINSENLKITEEIEDEEINIKFENTNVNMVDYN